MVKLMPVKVTLGGQLWVSFRTDTHFLVLPVGDMVVEDQTNQEFIPKSENMLIGSKNKPRNQTANYFFLIFVA